MPEAAIRPCASKTPADSPRGLFHASAVEQAAHAMHSAAVHLSILLFIKVSIIHYQSFTDFPHFSRIALIFTASGKGFLKRTKPLILLMKTAVKYINVKYVFLTECHKNGLFHRPCARAFVLHPCHPVLSVVQKFDC